MKKLYRLFILTCIFIFAIQGLFAAEQLDEDEIKTVQPDQVVFINYTGPHKIINTIEEIKDIGRGLARNSKDSTTGYVGDNKYQIIKCYDPSTNQGLDADILVLGDNCGVDHITNLRRIITAYLETAWGYSERDANTLATYVTVYNAVYRGNLSYFQKKYKSVVTDNLTAGKCGLALNYTDWPGKTQIVIPVMDPNAQGLGAVDTSVISDKKVVENMREEDDRSVDTRKDMVDIKEREADQAQEKAQTAQKEATTAKKEAEAAKKEADTAQKEAEAAQKKADANPDDKKAQETAQEKKAEAEEKAAVAEEKKAAAEEKSQEASTAQAEADKKRTEAQEERSEIAKDQQANLNDAKANANSTYGLRITDRAEMLSELVLVNKDNGNIIKESPVTVLRNRSVIQDGDKFIAIAGKAVTLPNANQAIKLVQLDSKNMEIQLESEEIVSPVSVLEENAGNYYCVIKDGDTSNWLIGKYSKELKLLAKSTVNVVPESPIMINSDAVVVTGSDNALKILSPKDLSLMTSGGANSGSTNTVFGISVDAK